MIKHGFVLASALMLGVATPVPAAAAPGTVASAHKLLVLLHVEDTVDRMLQPLLPILSDNVLSQLAKDASAPAAIRAKLSNSAFRTRASAIISDEFGKAFKAKYAAVLDATAQEYAASFTEEELQQILAFYSSGAGAKVLALQPQLQSKMAEKGRALGKEAGQTAIAPIMSRLTALANGS